MQETFKHKKSYYLSGVVLAVILAGLSILMFGIAGDTRGGETVFFGFLGLIMIALAIWMVTKVIKGFSYFIVVSDAGINVNDKDVIHWEDIKDFEIVEEGDRTPEKLNIIYQSREKMRETKCTIANHVEGFDYLKSIVKKHYQENALRDVDDSMKKESKG